MANFVYELYAKLGLDSSEYEEGLNEAGEQGRNASGKIGSALKTAGKVGAAAVAAVGTATVAMGKQAIESYADYEQLAGGVETLFKGSADAVMENASRAFESAGMSANEYMETVTSFSASLIQSTGRGAQTDLDALEQNLKEQYTATKRNLDDQYDAVKDHWDKRIKATKDSAAKESLREQRDAELKDLKRHNEDQLEALKQHNKEMLKEAEASNSISITTEESLARAAKLADQAIIDMSDNANKMGTDMQLIQNAYKGFAKQNFTMLDNLQIGYNGTKEEMERLLKDAERLSGQKFDISSYADIVEAIHVIQTEMGITGTTAEEASKTISGSANAMKAAWKNLLVGMADDNADIDKLIDQFVNSIDTVGKNILPRVQKILDGAVKVITAGAEKMIPMVVQVVLDNLPTLVRSAISLIKTIGKTLVDNLPQLLDAAVEIVFTIADGIIDALPELIPAIVQVILTIVEKLTDPDTMAKLISAAFDILGALAEGLIKAIPVLLKSTPEIIRNIIQNLLEFAPNMIAAGFELIGYIKQGITDAFPGLTQKMSELWSGVKETTAAAWDGIKTVISEKWDRIKTAYQEHGGGMRGVAAAYMQAIKERLTMGWDLVNQMTGGKLDAMRDRITNRLDRLKERISAFADKLKNIFKFSWELPKLRLPHFSWSWTRLGKWVSVPKISVQWYKRAYESPYLFDRPTVMQGFGDGPGSEIVYGHQNLMSDIEDSVVRAFSSLLQSVTGSADTGRDVTVILQLDRQQMGKATFRLYNEAEQKFGVQLAGGIT